MFQRPKITILLILISIFLGGYFSIISYVIPNPKNTNSTSLLSDEQKVWIKKYIFPYKLISLHEETIDDLRETIDDLRETTDGLRKTIDDLQKKLAHREKLLEIAKPIIRELRPFVSELRKKEDGGDITTTENIKKLSINKTLKKYELNSVFHAGINNLYPGSGYIDFYENNIIVLSSRGILAFKKNIEDTGENFQQIKNNINEFIGEDQFNKFRWFSLKDIFIFNNKVFVSYTEEIKEDCWNTSVIYGDMNYENIVFRKLFSPKECLLNVNDNIDKEFNAHQSGGRIISFDDNHILLSIGDYRSRNLAQDIKSVNGKIIKVNINNGNYEVISMGHRNPQGLYFDKENNFILETEHGPQGGDEVNLIEVNKINKDKIQNYGWPISSAGEHYGGKVERNETKYEKYPLYKSHSDHGFIEPLKSFVPSIGVSEIVKIGQNKYVVSSMRDKSLYFFELNKQKQITSLNRVEVFERVRDLSFKNNQLLLFMEDTASIGVLNLN